MREGNYNFECLEAIDIKQFNTDMQALLAGESVYLPIFDFKKGTRTYDTIPTKLGERDILVIEGIHCLNPELSRQLSSDRKFKIYISALTQLNIDEHNRIPSTDGRLIGAAKCQGCQDKRNVCSENTCHVVIGKTRRRKYFSISGRGRCNV